MSDFFSLLNETRRPWIDPEALKQKFTALSTGRHPDKIHSTTEAERAAATRAFAELNAAFQCLLEPKTRLLHLLELEAGAKPGEIQSIPAALADLFAEVATACKNTDAFLKEKAANVSPLLAVQWFERAQDETDRLGRLQKKLRPLRESLNDRLKALDQEWMAADVAGRRAILPQLDELYRLFGYFNRWNNQVQERLLQLVL